MTIQSSPSSPNVPKSHVAIKVSGPGTMTLDHAASLPTISPTEVLIRVACVGIQPVDGKSAAFSPALGATVGVDFSGVVVALGYEVSNSVPMDSAEHVEKATTCTEEKNRNKKGIKVGSRVLGCAFGNNPLRIDNGAFAEYVAAPACLVWHMADDMTMETGASLGTALATAGLALFQYLEIPMPWGLSSSSTPISTASAEEEKKTVLVYGGGTATGAMAIQMLSLAGYTPITTCSPSSSTRALSLGANATFDYHTPTCGADINLHTSNTLFFALDCISTPASMGVCYEALGSNGGRYLSLDPFPLRSHNRRSVVPDWMFVCSMFGRRIAWRKPYDWDPRVRDRTFADDVWFPVVQRLLDEGVLKPHPVEVRKGGLAAVVEGVGHVMKGIHGGRKLVYPVAEELCVMG